MAARLLFGVIETKVEDAHKGQANRQVDGGCVVPAIVALGKYGRKHSARHMGLLALFLGRQLTVSSLGMYFVNKDQGVLYGSGFM